MPYPHVSVQRSGGEGARADAHVHLFTSGELGVYERLMAEHGIERGLVVGYEGPALATAASNNARLREWAATRPWMAPLAYLSTAPPSAEAVKGALAWAAGVSVYADQRGDVDALDAWTDDVRRALVSHHAIVSINTRMPLVKRLRPFLESLTGASVLVSHLGLPPPCDEPPPRDGAAAAVRPLTSLAGLPHVGVKLSGFYAMVNPPTAYPPSAAYPYVEAVADHFGARRLYWGSDFPPVLAHHDFEQAVGAVDLLPWSQSEREDVMGRNLLRLAGG